MKISIFFLFGIIFAGINSQNLGLLNGCATSTLGSNSPQTKTDCWSDTSSSTNNCCFFTANFQGVSVNFCYPLPMNADLSEVQAAANIYGKNARATCSGSSISITIMLLALLALILF